MTCPRRHQGKMGLTEAMGFTGGESLFQELPVLGAANSPRKASTAAPPSLPVPFFPRHPEKCGNVEPDPKLLPREGNPYRTSVTLPMIRRSSDLWLYPYLGSRVKPGDFHPIISYLFTEWKCNLDCHYCWAYDNRVQGMTVDVARRSIDWLHDTGCHVFALMGGEVLVRPPLLHKVVDYAVQKGFWVYVPTNGRLMRPEVIDRLADAGVATFNLAVDSVTDRKELPKALQPIWSYFDYLIKKQYVTTSASSSTSTSPVSTSRTSGSLPKLLTTWGSRPTITSTHRPCSNSRTSNTRMATALSSRRKTGRK